MDFFDWVENRANQVDSLLCIGLDPRAESLAALEEESLRLIAATSEFAAAFKPNIAFFEAFGPAGLATLQAVIAAVPAEIPVILDAKRGDISSTSTAYATAVFDTLRAHALTVSPYLGGDAVAPFLQRPERGAFVLCKTSNPDADEFQSLSVSSADNALLYEVVAQHARHWSRANNLGLVVGATDCAALSRLRKLAPKHWFLLPGVGAQGGDLAAALRAGLRSDGLGLLVTVSRQLSRAADPAAEARRLRDAINSVRRNLPSEPQATTRTESTTTFKTLAQDLVASGCVRFGRFQLKSGSESPIYMDLRRLITYPPILRRVAAAYAQKLQELTFDRLAGIPYAALPIGTAIALETGRPLIYPRREAKGYGTRAEIEGEYVAGETVVVIDDVTTNGESKFEAIHKLEAAGLVVRDIVVLIDRMQGAQAVLAAAGYTLHSVLTLPALLDQWRSQGAITPEQHAEVIALLAPSTPR